MGIATGCGLDGLGINISVGEIFCTIPDCDPPSLLYNGYWVSFWVLKWSGLNLIAFFPCISLSTHYPYPQPPPPTPLLHPPHLSVHTTSPPQPSYSACLSSPSVSTQSLHSFLPCTFHLSLPLHWHHLWAMCVDWYLWSFRKITWTPYSPCKVPCVIGLSLQKWRRL